MDDKKGIIPKIREWIRDNTEEMSYYHDPGTPFDVVHVDKLEDFLGQLED